MGANLRDVKDEVKTRRAQTKWWGEIGRASGEIVLPHYK